MNCLNIYHKGEMKMEVYFEVKTLKDGGAYNILKVVPEALVPTIIQARKRRESVMVVKDNFGQVHTAEEMLEIFKESIEIEYEDVKNIKEATKIAKEYFNDLLEKNIINKEEYDDHIDRIDAIKCKDNIDKFINKIVEIYVS